MRPLLLTAAVLLASVASCAMDPHRSEESLVAAAFSAVARNDWERYRELIITPADLMLQAGKTPPLEAGLTYEGSVLRPEEREQHRQWFDQARRGGPGLIDFSADRVDRVHLVARGERELLSGDLVEVTVYAANVTGGAGRSGPLFQVVRWGSEFRILALLFPPGEEFPSRP